MAEQIKPNMSRIWASGGAILTPTDSKIDMGWTAEIPPHQWENFAQNRQDVAISYLFQHGLSEWDAQTEYFANRSYVQYNGVTYKAITNSLNILPTNTTNWVRWGFTLSEIIAGVSGSLIGVRVFSTPGTFGYTPTTGTKSIIVEGVGGGGGGGGVTFTTSGQLAAASGGSAGAYGMSRYLTGFTGLSVTVGAGGAGGIASVNTPQTGGSTSFGSLMSLPGGPPGVNASGQAINTPNLGTQNGGNSLAPSGTNLIGSQGQAGYHGLVFTTTSVSGFGGSGPFGSGGHARNANDSTPGRGYGAGGSGANNSASQASKVDGGAGSGGLIIIREFS